MLFLGAGRGRGGWGMRRGIGVFIPRIRYNGRLRQYESGPGTFDLTSRRHDEGRLALWESQGAASYVDVDKSLHL